MNILLYILENIYINLPFPEIDSPVFIIGCGRSGTTILGNSLSRHKKITYLNDPCHLWFSAFPETDIWSSQSHRRSGKLVLTEFDFDLSKSRKIRRLFRFKTIVKRRPILVEKLPINSFRLKFIYKIFPDARFIYIHRNGLEVARSIENRCMKGKWFGSNSYKWNMLTHYAKSCEKTSHLPDLCTTNYDKGLLEWRLSTESAVHFLNNISKSDFFVVSYDEFIDSPVETISTLLNFIGVQPDPNVESFVSGTVKRKSSKLGLDLITEKDLAIGGDLLQLSIKGISGVASTCFKNDY